MAMEEYSRRTWRVECVYSIILFALVSLAGWLYLSYQAGPPLHDYNNRDGRQFLPAVMWATGHGLSYPVPNPFPAPGLKEFILNRANSWDPATMPEKILTIPVFGKFDLDRCYLVYMVGIAWRLFGFSWTALNIPVALVYGVVALLIYGIFRLGAGRCLATLGTALAISSPILLYYLPSMRDFFRAPPILATIFVCGYLSSRRVSASVLIGLSALLGMAVGIGYGFRQDAVICLPPALVIIALFARGAAPLRIRIRIVAAAALVAAFTCTALPIIKMTYHTGGNNSFYLLQGFAGDSLSRLEIEEASYLPILSTTDHLLHAQICDFEDAADRGQRDAYNRSAAAVAEIAQTRALLSFPLHPLESAAVLASKPIASLALLKHGLPIWSPAAENTGRRMVRTLAMAFPADFISRWYSATVIALRDGMEQDFDKTNSIKGNPVLETLNRLHLPLANHLGRWSVWYCLAALILLSLVDFWTALAAVFVTLYFSGYTSLCFHWRAAFHVQFMAFWPPVALLGAVMALPRRTLFQKTWREAFPDGTALRAKAPAALSRMAFFFVLCAIGLLAPLYLARLYQASTAEHLRKTCEAAALEPAIPVEEVYHDPFGGGDQPIFKPAPTAAQRHRDPFARYLERFWFMPETAVNAISSEYLVAEMEFSADKTFFIMRYEDNGASLDFGYRFHQSDTVPSTYRIFIPVYTYSEGYRSAYPNVKFSSLQGVIPGNNAVLKAFYRVGNPNDFPVKMAVCLPAQEDQFRGYIGITPLRVNAEK